MAGPYTDDLETRSDTSEDATTRLKNKVSDAADKARDKVENMGRSVQDKIDETRAPAAERLESAGSALHEKADSLPGGETVSGLAHDAADKVLQTADYVREHDVKDMMADVESFIRRHPGQSLFAAAAVGFLVGRTFRSDD